MPYRKTGKPNGRPKQEDQLELRPGFHAGTKLKNWAVFELAAKERGFTNVGFLLDDTAEKMRADLRLPDAKIQEQAKAILTRLGRRA